MRLHSSLRKEPKRLAGIRVLLDAKDLHFHDLVFLAKETASNQAPADKPVSRVADIAFTPAWWLSGAHAQTLWGKFARRVSLPPGHMERWTTPDGDFLDLFRVPAPPTAPHLIVLHGLEGTLRSHYARGIASGAHAAGWGVDLLLFRGCSGEINRAPRFYHSGDTSDLAFVVQRIVREHPDAPLLFAGYSLGGNVLLKWLGEHASDVPSSVRGAVAVSVPFDLEAGAHFVSHGFSRMYERHFLRTLKQKAAQKLVHYPGLFNAAALRSARTLVSFDEVATAPVHGFSSAHDYYSRSSSLQFLERISQPTLLVSAFDDPFLPPHVLRSVREIAGANPSLTPLFVEHGGHVGFVAGSAPWNARYFAEEHALAFLASLLNSHQDLMSVPPYP
ncbi:MAG: hydrolase [Gemmatimonadaceae bacterium]